MLAEQVTNIVRVVLLWTEGVWNFDSRAHSNEALQAKVATPQLLLEATRRLDLGFAASRFPGGNETIFPLPDAANTLNLLPTEAFLLSRVEAGISVADLVSLSGLREFDAKQGLYGLTLAGFGSLTFLFAQAMAAGEPLARALCVLLTVFWTMRLAVMVFVFDVRPYLTNWFYRLGHQATNLVFIYLVAVYALTVWKGGK